MSTEQDQDRTTIADVLREYGSEGAIPDLASTMKRVETVNTVKFVFHPWMPINNIGGDTFSFNVHYAVLERLKLIPIPVFDYARIVPIGRGFAIASAVTGEFGAIPSRNQVRVETLMQMPSTSVEALRTAYSKFGLVELASLESHDVQGARASFTLFANVFREAASEADLDRGFRPPGLTLEGYPAWLDHYAPRVLVALASQVETFDMPRAEQLVAELRESFRLAEEAALSPSTGILPKTKELLNITANGGSGGKTHLDDADNWLLKQYPSFEMDTDVERARAAMQRAIESGNQGQKDLTATMVEMMGQQQQTLDLLTNLVANQMQTKQPKQKQSTE
jgi:hypothetical protein